MRPVLLLLTAGALCAQRQTFDVQMMLRLSRISEPALSPSGKQVAFTVQTVDLEKNIILVKGAVPGARGRIVFVRNAVKGA